MSFIIKPGDPIFYPSLTNEILIAEAVSQDIDLLQIKKPFNFYFIKDGKLKEKHQSPSIFPATKEWYDKLSPIYLNLHNPDSYNKFKKTQLVHTIIDKLGNCLVARTDNFNNLLINKITNSGQLGHYDYPINPYTLKQVYSLEEYLKNPLTSQEEYKYCVEVMEHEEGWGSKPDDPFWFDTEAEAEAFVMARANEKYASYTYVGLKLYKE